MKWLLELIAAFLAWLRPAPADERIYISDTEYLTDGSQPLVWRHNGR